MHGDETIEDGHIGAVLLVIDGGCEGVLGVVSTDAGLFDEGQSVGRTHALAALTK